MFGMFAEKHEWKSEAPKVVIVGAGVSGLIAGIRLTEAGADVTVVESERQVGGRVYSEKIGGVPANLGAQYFFECDNEYLNHYVRKAKKFPPYYGLHGALWDGEFVSSEDDSFFREIPVGEAALKDLQAAEIKMQAAYRDLAKGREFIFDKDPRSSVWEDLDSITGTEYLSDFSPDVANFYDCFLKPEGGTGTVGTTALLLVGWYGGKAKGPNYLIEGGNNVLPEAIAYDIREGGNSILLSTGVERITQSDSSATVHCTTGEVLEADYVVVTTTATVAKKIVTDLPEAKRKALEAVTYGASMEVGLHLKGFYPEKKVASVIFYNEGINAYLDQSKKSKKGEAVICLNITGQDAHELNDEGIIKRVTEPLTKIFAHFDPDEHIAGHSIKKWPDGIVVFPAGFQTKYQEALRAPVGRIHFGGDYTHNPALDGAAWAGVRSAGQIINRESR